MLVVNLGYVVKVCTEGRLILEFTFDDLMRIKSWHLAVRTHRELVPRSVVGLHSQQDPAMLDQLTKNITRQGITNSTLNYLRVQFKHRNSSKTKLLRFVFFLMREKDNYERISEVRYGYKKCCMCECHQ